MYFEDVTGFIAVGVVGGLIVGLILAWFGHVLLGYFTFMGISTVVLIISIITLLLP